jgi:hypothetical protein
MENTMNKGKTRADSHEVAIIQIGPKSVSSKSMLGVIAALVLGVGLVFLAVDIVRDTKGGAAKQAGDKIPDDSLVVRNETVKRVQYVEVGTDWYDSNPNMLRISVTGYPMAPDVNWEMRANHDDSTKCPIGPVNSPELKNHEFTGNIRTIEYRVAPGQAIDHCTFRFVYSPFK